MTTATDERHTLCEVAESQGWKRRQGERSDAFSKGTVRIRVVWQGDAAISGATLFHDEIYESYSRDLATVRAWLKR